MKQIYFTALSLLMLSESEAQVYDIGSWAQVTDISDNGVAVGNSGGVVHFKWSLDEGISVIGQSEASDYISGNTTISADGSKVAGTMTNKESGVDEMSIYDVPTKKWTHLGGLGVSSGGSTSSSWGLSSNGNFMAGLAWKSVSQAVAVTWSETGGLKELGSVISGKSSRANAINADGTVIVGWQDNENGFRNGAYWKNEELFYIKNNKGNFVGEAQSVSADGKVIVGYSDPEGYIWSEKDGYVEVLHSDPDYITSIVAISDDGNVAIGYSKPWFGSNTDGEGFIWFRNRGKFKLNDYVKELGYDDKGLDFILPTGISPNGEYIGGIAINWEENDLKGFVIKLEKLAINDINMTKKITFISPNPVIDEMIINTNDKINSVEIYNLAGQQVWKSNKVMNNKVNVEFLNKGIYILKINNSETIKFIKK